MTNDHLRQGANLLLAIAQPVAAFLVNAQITGPSIGVISDRYPTYVVPAGYAFSIWSLIFALSLGYGIWQALPSERENPLLRSIGWFSAGALASTTLWMPVFQRSMFGVSVLLMLCLLASLIGVVSRVYRWKQPAMLSRAEFWLVYAHFSAFLGWVTAATIANVGQTLTAYEWDGFGIRLELWGVFALLTAGVIGSVVTVSLRGNMPYALALIWALIAVAVNQFTRGVPTSSSLVGGIAAAMATVVGLAAVFRRSWRTAGTLVKT